MSTVLHWEHKRKSHGPGTGPVPVSMCGRTEVYFTPYPDNITCLTCKTAYALSNPEPHAAVKHDAGKPRVELVSEVALLGLAEVLTHGAEKYAEDNWRKGMEWRRLIGSAFRHLLDFSMGVDTDSDSGLPSIDHLACCVMFLSEYQKRKLGTDNRYKVNALPTPKPESDELQRRLADLAKLGFSFVASAAPIGSTTPIGGWSWRRKGEESLTFATLKDALDDAEADANSA